MKIQNIILSVSILLLFILILYFRSKPKPTYFLDKKHVCTKYCKMVVKNFRKVDTLREANIIFSRGLLNKGQPQLSAFVFGNAKISQLHNKEQLLHTLINRYGFKEAFTLIPPSVFIDPNGNFSKFFQQYSPPYMIKRNIENGKGLHLSLDRSSAMREIMRYRNDKKPYVLLQQVITPLLVNGFAHKIRFYIVVKCQNNNIEVYISKNGYIAYGKYPYDKSRPKFESLMASPHWHQRSKTKKSSHSAKGRPIFFSDWDIPNKPKIEQQLIEKTRKIFNAVKLCTGQNTVIVSGADYLIDQKYNVHFIELNTVPGTPFYGYNRADRKKEIKEKTDIYYDALSLSHKTGPTNSLIKIS